MAAEKTAIVRDKLVVVEMQHNFDICIAIKTNEIVEDAGGEKALGTNEEARKRALIIQLADNAEVETDRERLRQERYYGWVDAETVLGETYRYRVISVTTDAYVSQPSNIATIARALPSPPPRPADREYRSALALCVLTRGA